MTTLATLSDVPALLDREYAALAEITQPEQMADAAHRLAAIAELTKRAGLAVPIQNKATFYRAEALERLAGLVDETPVSELDTAFRKGGKLQPRVSEGRALGSTGALKEARAEAEKQPRAASLDGARLLAPATTRRAGG